MFHTTLLCKVTLCKGISFLKNMIIYLCLFLKIYDNIFLSFKENKINLEKFTFYILYNITFESLRRETNYNINTSSIMLSLTKVLLWSLILLCCHFTISCKANQQGEYLHKFIQSKRSQKSSSHGEASTSSAYFVNKHVSKVDVVEQKSGLMEANKVKGLPGQPKGVNFDQYAGYVTVDAKAGRALFYYFVESPQNSSTKPLVLWLNGGNLCDQYILFA